MAWNPFDGGDIFDRLRSGGRPKDRTNSNLSGQRLAGQDLSNTDFTGSNFSSANLSECNLTGSLLDHVNFQNALFMEKRDTAPGASNSPVFQNTSMMNSDFTGAQFSVQPWGIYHGVDLRGVCLDGSTFTRCNMKGCNLEGVDFRNVNGLAASPTPPYTFISEPGADFSGADLKGANFSGCDLNGTLFLTANLEGSDFSQTILTTDFPYTYVSQQSGFTQVMHLNPFGPSPNFSKNPANPTKFVGATLPFNLIGLDWSCKDLTDAKISDVPQDLTGLKASYLTAKGIDFSNRNLTNAVFDNADLTSAIFTESDMTGASFKGAKLYGATFSYATLNKADFTGAQLGTTEANLRSAVLSYANMRDAVFTDANLDRCVLNGAQWYGENAKADNAGFAGAKISEANLSSINLKEATLDNADFAGTILVNADLSGGSAIGAAFTDSHLQGAKFQGRKLNGTDFTNAAVALEKGVPLFRLDDTFISDLNAAHLSAPLKNAFADQGHELLDKSTVQVVTPGTEWTVANAASAMPTTGLGSMYETFTVVKTETAGLQVFGSALWVTQVQGEELKSIAVLCLPSTLDQASCTMDDSVVFPSGHNLTEFRSNEMTWEKLMTARTPPTPPKCVYTPGSWGCHPTRRPSS